MVTPDMHRVRDSIGDDEADVNFGFNPPCRDCLFDTDRDHRVPRDAARLPGMLLLPFRGEVTDYPINRHHFSDAADGPPESP